MRKASGNLRRRTLKRRLRNRTTVFGAWTSWGHPSITEAFAHCGVDFIGIDLEHSTISHEQAQRIIAACHSAEVACLPRASSVDESEIRQLLDLGADGIMVPNVKSPQEIERIIAAVKYPPAGKRGYGVARAQGYGFDFEEYTSAWNDSSTIVIQVETIEAVEKIESLLRFDPVDGVMIGPYDISGSLGIPGQLSHPKVRKTCERVIEVCRKRGKACGTHIVDPTPKNVREALKMGYTFVVLASDLFILWKWGQRMRELMHRAARG